MNNKTIALIFAVGFSTFIYAWQKTNKSAYTSVIKYADENTALANSNYLLAQTNGEDDGYGDSDRGNNDNDDRGNRNDDDRDRGNRNDDNGNDDNDDRSNSLKMKSVVN